MAADVEFEPGMQREHDHLAGRIATTRGGLPGGAGALAQACGGGGRRADAVQPEQRRAGDRRHVDDPDLCARQVGSKPVRDRLREQRITRRHQAAAEHDRHRAGGQQPEPPAATVTMTHISAACRSTTSLAT